MLAAGHGPSAARPGVRRSGFLAPYALLRTRASRLQGVVQSKRGTRCQRSFLLRPAVGYPELTNARLLKLLQAGFK